MDRERLVALTLDFTEAFNRDDLDAVVACFAGDGVYEEFDGKASRGPEAIRAAFAPQFRGDFGVVRFHREDLFVDPEANKAMISWTCRLTKGERSAGWQGLDLIHFDAAGKIVRKLTYAKAEKPLLRKLTG